MSQEEGGQSSRKSNHRRCQVAPIQKSKGGHGNRDQDRADPNGIERFIISDLPRPLPYLFKQMFLFGQVMEQAADLREDDRIELHRSLGLCHPGTASAGIDQGYDQGIQVHHHLDLSSARAGMEHLDGIHHPLSGCTFLEAQWAKIEIEVNVVHLS